MCQLNWQHLSSWGLFINNLLVTLTLSTKFETTQSAHKKKIMISWTLDTYPQILKQLIKRTSNQPNWGRKEYLEQASKVHTIKSVLDKKHEIQLVVAPTSWWHKFLIQQWVLDCHLEFIDHAGLLVTIHLSSSLSNPTENVNQFLKLYSYTCMLQTWTGLVTTTSPLQKHNSSILLCTPFSDKNCWGCPPKHHHHVSFFASNTCQKWTTKNPRPLVITTPPEVHVSAPWLFKSFHPLLLGSSSCVCPAMYAWAAWPGF